MGPVEQALLANMQVRQPNEPLCQTAFLKVSQSFAWPRKATAQLPSQPIMPGKVAKSKEGSPAPWIRNREAKPVQTDNVWT